MKKKCQVKNAVCDPKGKPLQTRLAAQLRTDSQIRHRIEKVDEDGKACRVISRFRIFDNAVCGVLISFEVGKSAQVVELIEDEEEIEMVEWVPGTEGATTKSQLVDGVLFFGVKDNTVLLLPSISLTTRRFETHLSWLLGERKVETTVEEGSAPEESSTTEPRSEDASPAPGEKTSPEVTNSVVLHDELTDTAKKMIRNSPKRSVVIGSTVSSFVPAKKKKNQVVPEKTEFFQNSVGFKVLEKAMPDVVKRLREEHAFERSNIEVTLVVRYKGGKQSTGQEVINSVSAATRNMEDEDVKIHFDDGTVLAGDSLKRRRTIDIVLSQNRNPDTTSVLTALREELTLMHEEGLI